jgi:hypothetical protein
VKLFEGTLKKDLKEVVETVKVFLRVMTFSLEYSEVKERLELRVLS